MLDHDAAYLACRAKLATLVVCDTGTMNLAAIANGYTRATGSFVTDGFYPGMEITPSNFTDTTPRVVKAVSALQMLVPGVSVDADASGRALRALQPVHRAYPNTQFTPPTSVPWTEDEWLPGPSRSQSLGPSNTLEVLPQYLVHWYGLANVGQTAVLRAANAVLALFAPKTPIVVGGDVLVVRSDVNPSIGQITNPSDFPGFAHCLITIPLRAAPTNTI